MSTPARQVVDWVILLEQLRDLGVRTGTISENTGIAVSTLREYRLAMKSPLHANGEAIIRYWCERTGLNRAQVPMTLHLPSAHQRR